MKNILFIVSLFFFFSCSKNKYEKELIGQWNDWNQTNSDVKFYSDSVVILNRCEKSVGTWKANSNTIYIRYSNKHNIELENFYYFLNKEQDSLFISYTDENEYDYAYRKVKNNWKHYLANLGLQIDLPKANFPLLEKESEFGIDIYVGYKNGELIVKDIRNKGLEDLMNTVYIKKEKLKKREWDSVNFNLIADKKIPKKQIDSIKKILKSDFVLRALPKIKIFRVYNKEKSDYGNYDLYCEDKLWSWYGRYE